MPERIFAARELSELFKVISHPDRIRIVEELGAGECDVNSLHDRLALPASRVSQHLAVLKTHRLVEERRDGRHRFYRLARPDLALWIVDGMRFLETRASAATQTRDAVESARRAWAAARARSPAVPLNPRSRP